MMLYLHQITQVLLRHQILLEQYQKDPECPGPNYHIGDVAQNQKEKVSGYELQPDPNNQGQKICVILYEDIGPVEQYLPSAQVASTTTVMLRLRGRYLLTKR